MKDDIMSGAGAIPKVPRASDHKACEDYGALSKAQQYTRQRVTRLCNKVESELGELTMSERELYCDKLNDLRKKLDRIHSKLVEKLLEDQVDEGVIDETVNVHEDQYDDRMRVLLINLQSVSHNADQSFHSRTPHSMRSTHSMGTPLMGDSPFTVNTKLRLPEIPFPKFSNSIGEDFEKFIYSFESIINKHNLPSYEKFIYLRNQLSKAPRVLVDSLDIDEQTYETAKALLIRAFSSDVTRKFSSIKKLSEIKMSGDPYDFIGEMRSIISLFDKLDVDIKTVLTYFIWNGMTEGFQDQLIQIVNTNSPSLDQIEDKIFEATERYIRLNKSAKTLHTKKVVNLEATNLAVSAEKRKPRCCILCKVDKGDFESHYISQCPVYDSVSKKLSKLKDLRGCTKCALLSHVTVKCQYKFNSQCKHCNGNHMSYLCQGKNVSSHHTANNLNFTETLCVSSNDSILLPTMTVNIDSRYTVRALKDGGSQRNFISESVVRKLKLPILDHVNMNIHGFNSTNTISTGVVKVSFPYGTTVINLNAVVVPDITITLKVKGLDRLVNSVVDKGYELADSFLKDSIRGSINDINLIIGAESEHLLKLDYVQFGDSCLISTPIGIMFTGAVSTILDNVDFLPDINSNTICESSAAFNIQCTSNNDVMPVESFNVLDSNGDIIPHSLELATKQMLNDRCSNVLNYDVHESEEVNEINKKLVDFTLKSVSQDKSGRLKVPLMWNAKISHRLGQNFGLSKKILQANVGKLERSDKLLAYDDVFREQEKMGVIDKIVHIDQFLEDHPESSFLPHMGVFKPDRDTTKIRVVFLSNLVEQTKALHAVSHNQAMLPGPPLNNKIAISLIFTRFDEYLITFDLRKAFLQISIPEEDQNRLLFLWYNDIRNNDFSLVAFRNLRLTFGLRPSPCILMLSLYKILIVDAAEDTEQIRKLKNMVYHMIYMDNGAATCNDLNELEWIYAELPKIFAPYKFELQQLVCNSNSLQEKIDADAESETPTTMKLLGLLWDRETDKYTSQPLKLDVHAKTKRGILSSINAVYDLFGIYSPLLHRARLFLQKVQTDKTLGWDTALSNEDTKEWRNIVHQANAAPEIPIQRFVGRRDDTYALVAFTDASKQLYGVVVYILNLKTNKLSFLLAKSKVINKQLEGKSIPSLEFTAITFGTETLVGLYKDLCGEEVVMPLKIAELRLFTDSMVCIHWLNSYANKFDKWQKLNVFILNRMKTIDKYCAIKPITFSFTEGRTNPADAISRPMSFRKLQQTCYHSGPDFLTDLNSINTETSVEIPNLLARVTDEVSEETSNEAYHCYVTADCSELTGEHVVPVEKYSSLGKLIRVTALVLKFVNSLKRKVSRKNSIKVDDEINPNWYELSCVNIISNEQKKNFHEIFDYFKSKMSATVPDLVTKFNLFIDSSGIIRVKSKMKSIGSSYPMLLPSKSPLTELIVRDAHDRSKHGGVYSVLKELRSKYWILSYYSTVKRVLKRCITCARYNNRAIKLNQNEYRDFRVYPSDKPFSSVFVDYMGPWLVKFGNENRKVYILIITCLHSRAINLKICNSADTKDFLRAVQLHVYEYGMFHECRADLGSQIGAGLNLLRTFFADMETKSFLHENGINPILMEQFCKGNSALGSLVESLVKQVKHLIGKSISNLVLEYFDFQFIVCQATHMVNRRPIAFKEGLRSSENVPEAITPEMLVHGCSLVSLNTIPSLQSSPDDGEPDWNLETSGVKGIRDDYCKIRKARERLYKAYHGEFLSRLIEQATDKNDRYKRVLHREMHVGDIVLLKDNFSKPTNYPMGRIVSTDINTLGETTAAWIIKGNREKVYRHATSVIPLLTCTEPYSSVVADDADIEQPPVVKKQRRKAAIACDEAIKRTIEV